VGQNTSISFPFVATTLRWAPVPQAEQRAFNGLPSFEKKTTSWLMSSISPFHPGFSADRRSALCCDASWPHRSPATWASDAGRRRGFLCCNFAGNRHPAQSAGCAAPLSPRVFPAPESRSCVRGFRCDGSTPGITRYRSSLNGRGRPISIA